MSVATAEKQWQVAWVPVGLHHGTFVLLALLILVNAALTPNFATFATLWNLLLQAAPALLLGVGMTLVLATGGIDLSVGSAMALASVAAVLAIPHGTVAAMLAGLGTTLALGVINGSLIAHWEVSPFLATLATLITGRGLAQVMSRDGEVVPFSDPAFEALGQGRLGPVPVPVALAALTIGAGVFVVRATTWGRYLLAIGGNERAAYAAGVPVGRTGWIAYLVSAVLAGVAGLIETARLGATDPANIGAGAEFAAIAGAVIGGTSLRGGHARISGTAAGVLILVVISASFNMLGISYAWSMVLQAAIILTAAALQGRGSPGEGRA
ncbi:MAG: ABC transporter permease [Gemmataceae bacterium]|nr:ABC transporter permease [Gemmataceae bacterium]